MGSIYAIAHCGVDPVIDHKSRYDAMDSAALMVPQILLDDAAGLLTLPAETLLQQPEVAAWLDAAYAALPLAALFVERGDLIGYLRDRLCVHVAAEVARSGGSHADTVELLWPEERLLGSRRASLAPAADATALWPAVKAYLQRSLTNPPWDGVVETFTSDVARIADVTPDAPEYRYYFRALGSMALDKLDDRFADAMDWGERVEPGWFDANVLPHLHPAGAFAYVAMFHGDRERLLALVEHPADAIASAALARLEVMPARADQLRGPASEVAARFATSRTRELVAIEELCARQAAALAEGVAFHERLFAAIVRQAARSGHRLATFAKLPLHRVAALRAIASLPDATIEAIARAQVPRAEASGGWDVIGVIVDALGNEHPLSVDLLRAHQASWRVEPLTDTVHLTPPRSRLLAVAMLLDAAVDPAAFLASTREAISALQRRLEGRYLSLDIRQTDDALTRLQVIGAVAAAGQATVVRAVLLDVLGWLRGLVARWRSSRCDLLDDVATSLLAWIEPSNAQEIDAGVAVLRAAARNEDLAHAWGAWVPATPDVRGPLLAGAHDAFLHEDAAFLANTARSAASEGSLYRALLDTKCAECETVALRRLQDLRGALAPLARAVLERSEPLAAAAVRQLLALVLPQASWQGWRRSLIETASRRVGIQIDEAEYEWARRLETTGLIDSANQMSLRRT